MPSDVWATFVKKGDKAVCKCGAEYSLGKSGATTNLSSHLQSAKHNEAMVKFDGPSAKKARTETLPSIFSPNYSKIQTDNLRNDVLKLIVQHNLPYSIAESPFLRHLIKTNYGTSKLPSRHDISSEVPKKAEECKESLRKFAKNQYISITLDEFSHREHSLLCITGAFLEENFEYCTRVLAVRSFTERHDAVNIASQVSSALDEIQIAKQNVVAATRDGAPNMVAGCREANIKSIHCFCHVLHLVVGDAVKRVEVESLIEKANKVANTFHRTPTATTAFRKIQGDNSTLLKQQVPTRWNSTLEMLRSLLYHRESLKRYSEHFPSSTAAKHIKAISDGDYDEIQSFVSVLGPFEDCTKMASYQNACVSCYPYFVKKLSEHLDGDMSELACDLQGSLMERTNELLNNVEVELAAFLDPRLCFRQSVYSRNKWALIKEKVLELLVKSFPGGSEEFQAAGRKRSRNRGMWDEEEEDVDRLDLSSADRFKDEVDRYLNEPKLPTPNPGYHGHDDIFKWWQKNSPKFPHLAILARKYLSISLSSVASERCFSKASLLFANSLRSRLPKDAAANLLHIKTGLADSVLEDARSKNTEEPEEIINILMENSVDFEEF